MGIYKKSNASLDISYFLGFFKDLNCPLIDVTEDNKIVIDNKVTITITVGSNVNYSRNFNFTENGNTWVSGQYYPVTVIVCCDDNFVYLKITSQNSSTTYTSYLYEKINGKSYSGHYIGNNINCNIYDVGIVDWDDASKTYYHKARLNYADQVGIIDYTNDVLFDSNYKYEITDPNFITCSTITENQIITFNGKNYFSIGSHTLFEITL